MQLYDFFKIMNEEEYENILSFIQSVGQSRRVYPAAFALLPTVKRTSNKANWRRKCKKFIIQDERLYKLQPVAQEVVTASGGVERQNVHHKLEVVREQELNEVLESYHGKYHVGRDPMLETLLHDVWWPRMREAVDRWIMACTSCQQRTRSIWKAPLQPILASRPMERWQIDFTGPYEYKIDKESIKKMCVLVVDCFSKMLWGDICASKECVRVKKFLNKIFVQEGVPPTIIQADNGGEFTGAVLIDWYKEQGVKG